MAYLEPEDQLRLAETSTDAYNAYKAHKNSITHFALKHLKDDLQGEYIGGYVYTTYTWCEYVLSVIFDTNIGNLREVDLSPMRGKVIEFLYDFIKSYPNKVPENALDVFSNVTRFVLPTGIVDWKDMDRLAEMCPNVREIGITAINVELRTYKSLYDLIEDLELPPSKFANLCSYDEQLRQKRKDPSWVTYLTVALRKRFPSFVKLTIRHEKKAPSKAEKNEAVGS
ncbi:hypothetical protein L596_016185 [Steinernema carpocapsae]|nr:hypothetical protein L596_016185 [Steinernema carpocapsae]